MVKIDQTHCVQAGIWQIVPIILVSLFFCIPSAQAQARDVNDLEFWLERLIEGDKAVMDRASIKQYNEAMLAKLPTTLYNLTSYPKTVSKEQLQGFLRENHFSGTSKDSLAQNVNLAEVKRVNPVHWGIAVRRSSLRLFPQQQGVFEEPDKTDFDLLQATVINPGEAVALLQGSNDGKWLFVQCENYRGWVQATDIAETDYETWLQWQRPAAFLLVTAAKLVVSGGAEKLLLEMGARLPLVVSDTRRHRVRLVRRQANGWADFIETDIAASDAVHVGNLEYTRGNVIRQAFRFYGQPYGWGGLKDSVDCSSFIMDIYRCFGFKMARDADTQEVALGRLRLVDSGTRQSALAETSPGATLHMEGHVMLYLGEVRGGFYVIHSSSAQGKKVTVTDIKNTALHNGGSYLSHIHSIKEWAY